MSSFCLNMKSSFILGCLYCYILVAESVTHTRPSDLVEWNHFKAKHRKTYRTHEEEVLRMKTFLERKKYITKHNEEYDKGVHHYRIDVNKFSDLADGEFSLMKRGFSHSNRSHHGTSPMTKWSIHKNALPKSIDWREKGAVTEVKDQANCLSCWIFSAVGAVESQHYLKTGELVSLSEQNVLDCLGVPGRKCPEGWMDWAYEYIQNNKGVDTEASYPYTGKVDYCRFNKSSIGAIITSYSDLPAGDESSLENAVANIGPVSVAIDSRDVNFLLYHSGIYQSSTCKNGEDDLDHGLLVVGYGEEAGQKYWLLKNSWGADWGENGYVKIARNKENHCGIATKSSYPII